MKLLIDESFPGEFDVERAQLADKLERAVLQAATELGIAKAKTYQSHTFEPQVGDKIRNVNPKCKHRGSEGTVTAVKSLPGGKGTTVKYRCENSGEHWTKGDVLEKTLDQLAPQSPQARKAFSPKPDLVKGERGGEIDVLEDLVGGLSELYQERLSRLKAAIQEQIK